MPTRYKAHFSYNYYQFVHFHSEKIFVTETLEQAEELAKNYVEERKHTENAPFLRSVTEVISTPIYQEQD
jgi:cytochrome oxidase Cu insertion factor (SCO1/SenC/PrrC family)